MPISVRLGLILIIDDEECMVDACRQVLLAEGYAVESAGTGELGLAKARDIRPDVVLVDLELPGIRGLDVLKQLERILPQAKTILVTGSTTIDLEEVILKGCAQDCLAKPFSSEQLKAVVKRSLERKNINSNFDNRINDRQ